MMKSTSNPLPIVKVKAKKADPQSAPVVTAATTPSPVNTTTTAQTLKALTTQSQSAKNENKENDSLKKNKQKKKKKKSDDAYKPGMSLDSNKKPHSENPVHLRADNSTQLPTGEPTKHHAVISKSFLKQNPDFQAVEDELINKFKELTTSIETHRDATPVEFSKTGTPVRVVTNTPSKTTLDATRLGGLVIFSNIPTHILSPVRQLDAKSDFYQSEQFKAIKKAIDHFKLQEIEVSRSLLKKSAKEIEDTGGKRSQAQQMVNKGYPATSASATTYAKATEVTELDIPCEWLHLLAYFLMGEQSQHDGNLVCGSKDANTLMGFVEAQYDLLAKTYPSFTLKICAKTIPDTHIASDITMTLSTPKNIEPHFEMPIYINAQTKQKPHVATAKYFRSLIKVLTEHATEIQKKNAPKK